MNAGQGNEPLGRMLVENINDVIFSLDAEGYFTYISPAIERFARYTVSQVLGQPFSRFVHPDDLAGLQASFEQTLAGSLEPYEFRVLARDGAVLHVRTSSRPLWEEGQLVGLTGVMIDITERKQAEEALRQAHAELEVRVAERTAELAEANASLKAEIAERMRAEQVQAAIYRISEAAQATSNLDQLFASIHTIIAGLMPAQNFYIALYDALTGLLRFPYHADEADSVWTPIPPGKGLTGYVLQTGQPLLASRQDLEQLVHSGQVEPLGTRPVDWLGVPLKTQRGEIIGVMVAQTYAESVRLGESDKDILVFVSSQVAMAIERKQAEEQVRKLNRMLQMINQVSQALVRATQEAELLQRVCQIIVEIGGYCLAWVGWAEQDEAKTVRPAAVAGYEKGYVDTVDITWADSERGRGPTGTAIRTARPAIASDILTDPLYAPWREQALRCGYASSIALPLLFRGQTLGALNLYAAEPDAFSAEEVELLTEMADDLAYGVAALRTRAEHQRAQEKIEQLYASEQLRAATLVQALDQQRELDRLQHEFIQNVSHELRTPLALIRGHAEMLESGWLGELQPAQQESISVVVRRAQMLSRLVDDIVSILELEQRRLVHEPLDLESLVRTCLADFRAAAEKAGLTLEADIAHGLPPLSSDPLALRRVLDNLISNASKFSPSGGRVTVRLYRSEETLSLEVIDTGIGVPPEHQAHIFERFYQVDGSATRRYGGVGLGLALVKETVQALGGQIAVESDGLPGRGSTFRVSLPVGVDGE